MNKHALWGIGIIIVLLGGWFFFVNQSEVVASDLVVEGDYAPENITLKDGATLTVKGDLIVTKTISCDGGPLAITVEGATTISGTLRCDGDAGDITLVAMEGLTMTKEASVEAGGNVQFVSSSDLLVTTQEDIDAKFAEIGVDSGVGMRVGPMVPDGEVVLSLPLPET